MFPDFSTQYSMVPTNQFTTQNSTVPTWGTQTGGPSALQPLGRIEHKTPIREASLRKNWLRKSMMTLGWTYIDNKK